MTAMTKIERVNSLEDLMPIGLAAGANVRTPCGPRRVENLRRGDLIVTRRDGLQPVRMIWTRTVTDAEMAADPSLAPIVLRPRAIGPMMPQMDVRIAAAHRILVPGYRLEGNSDTEPALVQARDIVGSSDASYIDRAAAEVTFYNLVFDSHQVFTANGLPVESFMPSQTSLFGLTEDVRNQLLNAVPVLRDGEEAYPGPEYPVQDNANYKPEWA